MHSPEDVVEHRVLSGGAELSVLELPAEDSQAIHKPPLIMVHGLRDSAWSLLPVALQLTDNRRVLLPELRGHGRSESSDTYSIFQLITDLVEVIESLHLDTFTLFGHSLGGHIATKFAAIFPNLVTGLIIIEGLGPPDASAYISVSKATRERLEMQTLQSMLQTRLRHRAKSVKIIASIEAGAQRLQRNNPRLSSKQALRPTQGGFAWAFDPRANSVFVGATRNNDAKFWRNVNAPTCIVSGALSYEYWTTQMGHPAENEPTGKFGPGEIEARVGLFADAEHHWLDGSGHMVHYDQPNELAQLCLSFLSRQGL